MAVNGVLRRWNWCVESLHKEKKKISGCRRGGRGGRAAPLPSPAQFPNRCLSAAALLRHTSSAKSMCVCGRDRKQLQGGKSVKCLWTDSCTHHDSRGRRNSSFKKKGGGFFLQREGGREGEGLVVLKKGQKVVVAVGWKVGGVQV